jgi:hypothetical protein
MNVKSGCEKAEAKRRRDAAPRRQTHMNMSKTPFTNIKTCNGGLDAQAKDNRRRRVYETLLPFLRFWPVTAVAWAFYKEVEFQPFLRFWRSSYR